MTAKRASIENVLRVLQRDRSRTTRGRNMVDTGSNVIILNPKYGENLQYLVLLDPDQNINLLDLVWIDEFNLIQFPEENEACRFQNQILPGFTSNFPSPDPLKSQNPLGDRFTFERVRCDSVIAGTNIYDAEIRKDI
ncbi:hypothetical protein ACTXT7_011196 [Hymenolepis weldensis]